MFKGEIAECPICKKEFKRKNAKQLFCSIKCYRIHYKTASKTSQFPFFICPECRHKEPMDFMPNRKRIAWEDYRCSKCGFLANTSEERDYPH